MKIYMHALNGVLGIIHICSAWFLDIRISTCFYCLTGIERQIAPISLMLGKREREILTRHWKQVHLTVRSYYF